MTVTGLRPNLSESRPAVRGSTFGRRAWPSFISCLRALRWSLAGKVEQPVSTSRFPLALSKTQPWDTDAVTGHNPIKPGHDESAGTW
jgi:hypothetical protein